MGVLITYSFFVTELLPEILSTGLKEDRMSVVNLILSTLKTRVSVCSSFHTFHVFNDLLILMFIDFCLAAGCTKQGH